MLERTERLSTIRAAVLEGPGRLVTKRKVLWWLTTGSAVLHKSEQSEVKVHYIIKRL